MDEKTEELRDIFMDVTDESTVTEQQEETHGSLSSETEVDERLEDVVARMRDRYDFGTTLSRARIDLHLIRDTDTDAPFDMDDLRDLLDRGATTVECAEDLDVSE